MLRLWLLVVVIASALMLTACGAQTAPSANPAQANPSTPAPASDGPATGSAQKFSIGDVFPPGPGRDLALNNCGSCHPVVCSARGQRTPENWEGIKDGHKDKLGSLSSADLDILFSYLKENFNNTKPEPKIPEEFLQQGCTPF